MIFQGLKRAKITEAKTADFPKLVFNEAQALGERAKQEKIPLVKIWSLSTKFKVNSSERVTLGQIRVPRANKPFR